MPKVTVPPALWVLDGSGIPLKLLTVDCLVLVLLLFAQAASAVTPTTVSTAIFVAVRANVIVNPPGSCKDRSPGLAGRPWSSLILRSRATRSPPPVFFAALTGGAPGEEDRRAYVEGHGKRRFEVVAFLGRNCHNLLSMRCRRNSEAGSTSRL